ncbi:hypothetical protein LCGC14_2094830 [marine sediment metagenome]|uniref:Uncharacterized protein n=1 Tax=marine sediment metagenome TaxID=412755 RepID=A0A0F9EBL3_9ZZZZ
MPYPRLGYIPTWAWPGPWRWCGCGAEAQVAASTAEGQEYLYPPASPPARMGLLHQQLFCAIRLVVAMVALGITRGAEVTTLSDLGRLLDYSKTRFYADREIGRTTYIVRRRR